MWVRGHSNTPCYWNRPDKTAQTMREDGWIWTGDCMVDDANGFFTFVGRVDELIKVSGQWIRGPVQARRRRRPQPSPQEDRSTRAQ